MELKTLTINGKKYEMSDPAEEEDLTNYPTLKKMQQWYSGTTVATVTEVRFVENYTPTAEGYVSWDAGVEAGAITAYREGNILTVSANGKKRIKMNPSSQMAFAGFLVVKAFYGLEMLDASEVTNMAGLFNACRELTAVDVSFWNCDKVTKTNGMFYQGYKLRKVKMPQGLHLVGTTEVMFEDCHKLTDVDMGSGLVVISNKTFAKCINLERITGLSNVTTIGDRAFVYTAKLKDVDLNPAILTSIGESAFRLSSMEDCIRMDDLNTACTIGSMATRAVRWPTYSVLGEIQDKVIPTVMLRVPHADSQMKYDDFVFANMDNKNDNKGEVAVNISIAEGGCMIFAWYHEWQCVNRGTDKELSGFEAFWKDILKEPLAKSSSEVYALLEKLGWDVDVVGSWEETTTKEGVVTDPLDIIITRLNNRLPTFATVLSANLVNGYHAVLIVGGDTLSGKLAILDSKISNDKAELVWVKYEDIFTQATDDYDGIRVHTY